VSQAAAQCNYFPCTVQKNADGIGIFSGLDGFLDSFKGLEKRPTARCKTVYPGSIPGVASTTRSISRADLRLARTSKSFRAAEPEGHGNLQEISSSAPGVASDFPLRLPCEQPQETIMTKIVLAFTLSAAVLAGPPVSASDRAATEKDRCELKQDATELTVACQKSPRKNATPLNELTRKDRGLLPER
jgi:hypothetical protein